MSFITGTSQELIYANTTSGTAKNTFTSEANINDTAGMGERANIPPYFFMNPYGVGRTLHIIARGILSSTVTPNYTITIRLGATGSTTAAIILGTAAVATISGAANRVWELDGHVVMRAVGTAGANSTVQGLGTLRSAGLAVVVADAFAGAASPGTVATVDNSITNFINVNATCSASSASNQIQLLQLLVFGCN